MYGQEMWAYCFVIFLLGIGCREQERKTRLFKLFTNMVAVDARNTNRGQEVEMV